MEAVNVDWEELELSCERNGVNVDSFLDLETGAVLVFYHESEDEEIQYQKVLYDKKRYVKVEPAPSREQYRWMEKFVSTVSDPELQKRLLIAIDGKGAFKRFKHELINYPGVRERWYSYRSLHLRHYINGWLQKNQIDIIPPWGLNISLPQDDPVSPSLVVSELSPTEILRRKAKEIIDLVPGNDLASAIAFLEYLRDRNSSENNNQK